MKHPADSFTSENWCGRFYELYIESRVNSLAEIHALLAAIWSNPSLNGCYLRRDLEPSLQPRCSPDEGTGYGHLYGIATLPGAGPIVCGSYAFDFEDCEDDPPRRYLGFYFPLAALSHHYEVGTYPFGPISDIPAWRTPIDDFLRRLANWTFARVPFDLGIVGFEIGGDITAQGIRSMGIPDRRPDGILWNGGGMLEWYEPNLP
jgi:hypothetical protein